MASELRVNTIKDASGNNSVATSTVAQGSAKAWANYVGSGTTLEDSFNTASATDNGTGQYTYNWSSNLANATYEGNVFSQGVSTANTACYSNLYFGGMAAGSLRVNHFNEFASALGDTANISVSVHGDLA